MSFKRCVDCNAEYLDDGNSRHHCMACRVHDGIFDELKVEHVNRPVKSADQTYEIPYNFPFKMDSPIGPKQSADEQEKFE